MTVSSEPSAVASLFEKKTPESLAVKVKHVKTAKSETVVAAEKSATVETNPVRDAVKDARTLFVGNVPLTCAKRKIEALFRQFGDIESVRMRGLPVSDKWQGKKKRVGVMLKDFKKDSETCHAYVVFKAPESVMKAIRSDVNGSEGLGAGYVLRLDTCVKNEDGSQGSHFDRKRTIYAHLVPSDVKESEIREAMETACPNVRDKIKGIRVCRIKASGKSFAYVMFTERNHVKEVLAVADDLKIRGKLFKVERVEKPEDIKKRKEEQGLQRIAANAAREKSIEKLQKRFGSTKSVAKGFINARSAAHKNDKPGNVKKSSYDKKPFGKSFNKPAFKGPRKAISK